MCGSIKYSVVFSCMYVCIKENNRQSFIYSSHDVMKRCFGIL